MSNLAPVSVLRYEKEFTIPFPAARVWPLLADTDRMNRSLGLPAVRYAASEDAAGRPLLIAQTRYRGIPMKWIEHPFEWTEGRGYSVLREFLNGPLDRVTARCELREQHGECTVKTIMEFVPRNLLGSLAARFVMWPTGAAGMAEHCARVTAILEGREREAFVRPEPIDVNLDRLEHKLTSLQKRGFPPLLLDALREHLVRADDGDVVRMRPFALADRWKQPRRDVLRLFLHATAEGVLALSWNVLCPNCRIAKADFGTLHSLREGAHCDVCRIDFQVDFDRLVELRFNVRPDIRHAELAQFCLGGPRNTPHIVAQAVLPAATVTEWDIPAGSGVLRLRVRETKAVARIFRDDHAPATTGVFHLTVEEALPRSQTIKPLAGRVEIRNDGPDIVTVMLEKEDWPDDACSAALVSTLAEFRRLFSAEVLAPNLQVGIQNLAVLFSDLKGSTQFYQDVGDAQAFAVVRDHFDILGRIVETHDGTFVKTMGDAIMAVFLNGRDALRAALEMQDAMARWDDARVPDNRTFVKIGLHQGPVISVTFNDRLDYFGTTVNLAARVQTQSLGGDVVISEAVADDPEVAALLVSARVSEEHLLARLPGFSVPMRLRRLRLGGPLPRSDSAEDAVPLRRN